MAHTIDRTMLADLGFADPDKYANNITHPEHDRAIEYLTQPYVASKLAEILCPRFSDGRVMDFSYRGNGMRYHTYTPSEEQSESFSAEVPIVQQEKNFRRFVGFLDAIMSLMYEVKTEEYDRSGKLIKTENSTKFRYVII